MWITNLAAQRNRVEDIHGHAAVVLGQLNRRLRGFRLYLQYFAIPRWIQEGTLRIQRYRRVGQWSIVRIEQWRLWNRWRISDARLSLNGQTDRKSGGDKGTDVQFHHLKGKSISTYHISMSKTNVETHTPKLYFNIVTSSRLIDWLIDWSMSKYLNTLHVSFWKNQE